MANPPSDHSSAEIDFGSAAPGMQQPQSGQAQDALPLGVQNPTILPQNSPGLPTADLSAPVTRPSSGLLVPPLAAKSTFVSQSNLLSFPQSGNAAINQPANMTAYVPFRVLSRTSGDKSDVVIPVNLSG